MTYGSIHSNWVLIAKNKSGASLSFHGDTKNEVIGAFNSRYNKSGFMIKILNKYTGEEYLFKKTFI